MSNLAKGLVFAGLGAHPGASMMVDSARGNNGTLTNMDPASDWVFVPELGRWGTRYTEINQTIPVSDCLSLATPLTLCGWAMCPTTPSYQDALCPLWKPNEFAFGLMRGYHDGTGENAITAATYDESATTQWRRLNIYGTDESGAEWVAGEWVHVAFQIFSRSRVIIWANGNSIYDGFSDNWHPFSPTTHNVAVRGPGTVDVINDYADGSIADPLGYSRILTPTEIADLADPSNVSLSGMLDWGRTRKRYFLPTSSSIIPHVMHYRRLMST